MSVLDGVHSYYLQVSSIRKDIPASRDTVYMACVERPNQSFLDDWVDAHNNSRELAGLGSLSPILCFFPCCELQCIYAIDYYRSPGTRAYK